MNNRKKWKIELILLYILLFFLTNMNPLYANDKINSPKAIILIIDQVGVEDLVNARTPNIDELISQGGFGIMNSRPEAILNQNRASSYQTLGMGVRITAQDRESWNLVKTSNDSWVVDNFDSIKLNMDEEKLKRLGFIGKTAKSNGLVVGLIGNADIKGKEHREGALIAIDENGKIPVFHPETRTLSDAELKGILETVDILFIDFGQTVVANMLGKDNLRLSIEDADKFLGKIIKQIGLKENLFMVITPNPSVEGFKNLNLALTPVILSNPSSQIAQGLLTSTSTKRDGLVTNLNFAPTLFDFFRIDINGEKIFNKTRSSESVSALLVKNEKLYLNLNKTRYLLHGTYIFLILLILVSMYTNKLKFFKKGSLLRWLSLIIISIPLASMVAPMFIDYSKVLIGHIIIISLAVFYVGILSSFKTSYISSVAWTCILTSTLILGDTYLKLDYLLDTPFGFNDVIIGGRFYGINNDLMGILVGTSVLGVFLLGEHYKLKVNLLLFIGLIFSTLTVLALSPLYGANVGGTIGASVILVLAVLITLNKKLSFLRLFFIIIGVFTIEIGIAALDAAFSDEITHAGKFFNSIITNGLSVLFHMIIIKIKQILLMLILPPWNFVLFLQGYIMWCLTKESTQLTKLKEEYNAIYKGFKIIGIGSLVIFAFNDTGVISSAIMLTYLLVPIGYIINYLKREG